MLWAGPTAPAQVQIRARLPVGVRAPQKLVELVRPRLQRSPLAL
jgi:hypothetical protein